MTKDQQHQPPLFLPKRVQSSGFLHVIDDYGPMGRTASAPHYVRVENGQEYVVKGPSLEPSGRYVAANEVIAVGLADRLGLPVLDHRIVLMGNDLLFASAYMTDGTFYPEITEGLFDECLNRESVYDLVAFDTWLCNVDRHTQNLLVREHRDKSKTLLLNDHGHCLSRPGRTPTGLAELLGTRPSSHHYVRINFIRRHIRAWDRLQSAIKRIENLHHEAIRLTVRAVPEAFLTDDEVELTETFLLERRAELRRVFEDDKLYFDAIEEAA